MLFKLPPASRITFWAGSTAVWTLRSTPAWLLVVFIDLTLFWALFCAPANENEAKTAKVPKKQKRRLFLFRPSFVPLKIRLFIKSWKYLEIRYII